MRKHFTVTGFVVHGDKTLLLWHPYMRAWVPPGGHIEPDEDPQEAVLREIREETGLEVCPFPVEQPLSLEYPRQIPAPVVIQIEDSFEPGEKHQHVDLIYFCTLLEDPPNLPDNERHLTWVKESRLRANKAVPLTAGRSVTVPEDVRLLGLAAIAKSREAGGTVA
jgi:8-oxo-dGTP diphosphatase